ncbi:MAG: HIT family protein [Anaerolineales bacterium]
MTGNASPAEAQCFVCQKHRGLIQVPGGAVFEDDRVFAGHAWSVEASESPYLGAFIVEPKRHIPSWADLDDPEAGCIGVVIRDVARALRAELEAEHIYVFVMGHNVPHLHVWVVPRFHDTPREYWGFELFNWPDRPVGGAADVEAVCERIRSRIAV